MNLDLRPVMGGPPSLQADDGAPFDVAVAPEELFDASMLTPTPGCSDCVSLGHACPACARVIRARQM